MDLHFNDNTTSGAAAQLIEIQAETVRDREREMELLLLLLWLLLLLLPVAAVLLLRHRNHSCSTVTSEQKGQRLQGAANCKFAKLKWAATNVGTTRGEGKEERRRMQAGAWLAARQKIEAK